jgi:hypothetical protein
MLFRRLTKAKTVEKLDIDDLVNTFLPFKHFMRISRDEILEEDVNNQFFEWLSENKSMEGLSNLKEVCLHVGSSRLN